MFGFSFYDVLFAGTLFGIALGTMSVWFFHRCEKKNIDLDDYEE